MQEQQLYWKELFQLYVHGNYVERFLQQADKTDRSISIYLAICSSTSIAAWVVWKDYALVWAVLIASSQVVQAIRPYFPYQERIKHLSALRNGFATLFAIANARWPSIAEGTVDTADISKYRSEIALKQIELESKAFPGAGLPENQEFLEEATVQAEQYFKTFYGV